MSLFLSVFQKMNVVEILSLNENASADLSHGKENDNLEFEIKEISGDESYDHIFQTYIIKNIPFLLHVASCDWMCLKTWITNEKPDFEFLKSEFGSTVVPVADCGVRYYNAQEKENMLLSDFLDYWMKYINLGYPESMKCLYLKDWHFTRDFPDKNAYVVPKYFSSDWLNEFLTSKDVNVEDKKCDNKDDYRFVYMGPKGTWTPFHADVFSSFSWSANICGKKKWRLFPPGEEKYLKDKFGNFVYDVDSDELKDSKLYPHYSDSVKYFELIQGPGDAIFVPSGWYHQVWNLDDTISVNHNWINGCNIHSMWQSLKLNLLSVKKEIADCQGMDGWFNHCQIMLKASYGIDYLEFYMFIKYIANKRISQINNNQPLTMYGGWKLGKLHAFFDLIKVNQIVCDVIADSDFKALEYFKKNINTVELFSNEILSVIQ